MIHLLASVRRAAAARTAVLPNMNHTASYWQCNIMTTIAVLEDEQQYGRDKQQYGRDKQQYGRD
jgi:hypothetical protein